MVGKICNCHFWLVFNVICFYEVRLTLLSASQCIYFVLNSNSHHRRDLIFLELFLYKYTDYIHSYTHIHIYAYIHEVLCLKYVHPTYLNLYIFNNSFKKHLKKITVVVWIWSILYRLKCLKTWLWADGGVLKGGQIFRS